MVEKAPAGQISERWRIPATGCVTGALSWFARPWVLGIMN